MLIWFVSKNIVSIAGFILIPVISVGQIVFCGEPVPVSARAYKKLVTVLEKQNRIESLTILKARAAKYWPIIVPILKQNGIPEDFRFLPLIESALLSNVTSSAGAKGYWQFMPATAKEMGLNIGSSNDERTHIVKSTQAACRLIKILYKSLNSWTLTAAAYNFGIGNLSKAITVQKQKNYYNLRLNRETGEYVYKLIALKELFNNPNAYRDFLDPINFIVRASVNQEHSSQKSEETFYDIAVGYNSPIIKSGDIQTYFNAISLEVDSTTNNMLSLDKLSVVKSANIFLMEIISVTGDQVDLRVIRDESGIFKRNQVIIAHLKNIGSRWIIRSNEPVAIHVIDDTGRPGFPLEVIGRNGVKDLEGLRVNFAADSVPRATDLAH